MEVNQNQVYMNEEEIKMIVSILNKKVEQIKKGFEIIPESVEADGCDEYGFLYWVTCRNRWTGREHEVPNAIYRKIHNTFVKLIDNGFLINNKKIVIEKKFLLNINSNDIHNYCVKNEDIKLMKNEINYNVKNELELLKKKMLSTLLKKTPYYFNMVYQNKIMCDNVNIFKKSFIKFLKRDIYSRYVSILEDIILKGNLTEKEKKLLGLEHIKHVGINNLRNEIEKWNN